MTDRFRDKVVLVTGGSRGIGFACARKFQGEGARIAIVGRDQAALASAANRLPGALIVQANLSDEVAARHGVEKACEELGAIDILVNCAGAARRTPPDELTPQSYRAAMDAKYFTYVNVIDPVVKQMAERGSGVIVNVIGAGGKVASPVHIPGGAANAALMLVTAGLASAYA